MIRKIIQKRKRIRFLVSNGWECDSFGNWHNDNNGGIVANQSLCEYTDDEFDIIITGGLNEQTTEEETE